MNKIVSAFALRMMDRAADALTTAINIYSTRRSAKSATVQAGTAPYAVAEEIYDPNDKDQYGVDFGRNCVHIVQCRRADVCYGTCKLY